MGNAGDLLKHGALAEFIRWRRELLGPGKPLCFLDPFGGLPFCGPCAAWCREQNPAINRFRSLAKAAPECALVEAQRKISAGCYYGSSHIARLAANKDIEVFASDRSESCRGELEGSGIRLMDEKAFPGFNAEDAFTVLDVEVPQGVETAVLLDPFAEFVRKKQHFDIIPQIARRVRDMSVILFVPVPKSRKWRDCYAGIRDLFLPGMWTMSCRPIKGGRVLGEENHIANVVLCTPHLSAAAELRNRLDNYAGKLAKILELSGDDAEMLKPQVIGRDG